MDAEKCDQEIFTDGVSVGVLCGIQGAANIQEHVGLVSKQLWDSKMIRIDWHYMAGWPHILTLDNPEEVRNEFIKRGYTVNKLPGEL